MHATSAVAIAIVALSAASSLAVPMGSGGEGLEARSVYERALTNPTKPVPAANPKGATIADSTKPGSNRSSGAVRTLTLTVRPRPTACKPGERPTVRRKTSSRKGSLSRNRAAAAANPADTKRASPAQGVVARAVEASPTATAKTTPPAATPTPPPKGSRKGGAVYRTITHIGKNGKTTIGHLVRGSRTRCFAPTSRPQAKGAKGAKVPGAALKDTATATGGAQPAAATNQAALGAKPPADPKLAARAIDILERHFAELNELD